MSLLQISLGLQGWYRVCRRFHYDGSCHPHQSRSEVMPKVGAMCRIRILNRKDSVRKVMEIENKLIRETEEDWQAVPRAHLKEWSQIYSTNWFLRQDFVAQMWIQIKHYFISSRIRILQEGMIKYQRCKKVCYIAKSITAMIDYESKLD